jgi:hypothetical protein
MQRVRTLAARGRVAIAVVPLLAGLALTGCRTDPSIAAYVGDLRITEAEVDEIVEDAAAKVATAGTATPTPQPTPEPGGQPPAPAGWKAPTRTDVLITLVLGKLCADDQAAKGYQGQSVTPQQVAEVDRVPADSTFAVKRAGTYTCLSAAPSGSVQEPSDAEIEEIYKRAVDHGLSPAPLNDIRDQLKADAGVRQALGVRRFIDELVKNGNISVNPRYRPMEFPVSDLGSGYPLIVATVGEAGSGAVRDLT